MFKNRLTALTTAIVLTSLTVFGQFAAFPQEEYTRFKSEASVQAPGSFVTQTTQNGVGQGATDRAGVLATYRYYFTRHHGIEANYSWTPNTQTYNGFGVDTNSHEISAAYIFRMPMRHWSPFVLAGAAALIFDPKDFVGASAQTRAAFVYGGGVGFNLTYHLFRRRENHGGCIQLANGRF